MKIKVIFVFLLVAILVLPFLAQATNTANPGLLKDENKIINSAKIVTKGAGYSNEFEFSPSQIAIKIIQYLLSFLGVAFFLIILYAGWQWLTAGGNEEQVTEAKNWLRNGVIGLVIIFGAYLITSFVISQVGGATGYQVNPPAATVPPPTS
ncbi:MAG: hypothetical protein WCT37_03525 [Patescibacteria group bacterium]|jgi:hypothetical protein